MGKLMLGATVAALVGLLTVGTAQAYPEVNFRPRGPFATLQQCEAVKADSARHGEQQGSGACFAEYGKGFFYMVKNGS